MPEAVSVFLIAPSWAELERRLRERGTESEEEIQRRLAIAREEAKQVPKYQYIVVNDTVPQAVEEFFALLAAQSCRTERRIHLLEEGV